MVVVPLAAAGAAFLAPATRIRHVGLAGAGGTLAATVVVVASVWTEGPVGHAAGGWPVPLGVQLYADGLAAVFLATTAVVGMLVSIYATAWFPPGQGDGRWREQDSFWALWLLLWGSLNAVYVAGDAFNAYISLEVMGLSAVALVALPGGAPLLRAGARYLFAAMLGSFSYLLGVAVLYAEFDTLSLTLLGERAAPGISASVALVLITAGLALKSGLFPLHFWLPPAHARAPAPVSAVLSGLVVKASYFLLLRYWLEVLPGVVTPAAAQLLGVVGAAGMVWGATQAILTPRLKLLVAHSTVAQIGFLFMLVPLAFPPGGTAPAAGAVAAGAACYAAAHALAKAALFLAAGNVGRALGHDRISDLQGAAGGLPVTMFGFGLAAVSLVGLPPTGGFLGKWLLLGTALDTGQWWWLLGVGSSALFTAAYHLRVARAAFARVGAPPGPALPWGLQLPPLVLAAGAVLLGLRGVDALTLLGAGALAGGP